MATGYSTIWTKGWASLRIYYSTSYDASTNKSTVTVTPQLKSQYNYGNDYRLYSYGVSGAGVYGNGSCLFAFGSNYGTGNHLTCGSANSWASFNRSFSFTVSHNSSGDASFTVGVLGSVRHFYNGGAVASPVGSSASGTITIHENAASSVASSTASVATQGSYALTVNRIASTNRHKARFLCGSDTLYTSDFFDTSLSLTVPRSWFSNYPSLASLPVTVSVQTYDSGGSAVGSPVSASLTVTADADMRPSVSAGWAALTAYNTGAAAQITGYVKGYSRAEAAFDPSKIDFANAVGASLASYSVSCQGAAVSASPYRTDVLASSSVTVVCTVADTRGRTASESFSLSVMDYAPPLMTAQTVFRCRQDGTPDEDGTYLSVKALISCSPLNGQNSCALSAAVMVAGGSYGAETALTSAAASVIGPYSPDLSHTVRFTAADALGNTAVYYVSVPTRKWALKFRPDGRGVAFGKAAETDSLFEIADGWAVKSRGIVDLIYPVGSIYLSVSAANPGTLFGGTWEAIEDVFLLAAGLTYTAGSTGGEAAHTLTSQELPSSMGRFAAMSYPGDGYTDGIFSKTSQTKDTAWTSGSKYGTTQFSAAGGGRAHNNMPPYLAVYIWKRTA